MLILLLTSNCLFLACTLQDSVKWEKERDDFEERICKLEEELGTLRREKDKQAAAVITTSASSEASSTRRDVTEIFIEEGEGKQGASFAAIVQLRRKLKDAKEEISFHKRELETIKPKYEAMTANGISLAALQEQVNKLQICNQQLEEDVQEQHMAMADVKQLYQAEISRLLRVRVESKDEAEGPIVSLDAGQELNTPAKGVLSRIFGNFQLASPAEEVTDPDFGLEWGTGVID